VGEPVRRSAVPRSRYLLFFLPAALGCAIDLGTKAWVFHRLGNREVTDDPDDVEPPIWLWNEVFGFETSLNEGALFGMGQGFGMLFVALSIVAFLLVVYWLFVVGAARDRLLTFALGWVTAGIFGNLYDRLGLPGLRWTELVDPRRGHLPDDRVYAVRDWIHFKIDALNFDWPIFNVADSLLVCGAVLLVWHALCYREPISPTGSGPCARHCNSFREDQLK